MFTGWAPWGCAVSWHSWWWGCRAACLPPGRLHSVAGWWPSEVWLIQLPQLLATQVGVQSSVDKLGDDWVPEVWWGQELKEGGQQVEAGWLFRLQLPPHSALVWAGELNHLPARCCWGLRWVQGPEMVQGTELQAAFLSLGTTQPEHLELRGLETWQQAQIKIYKRDEAIGTVMMERRNNKMLRWSRRQQMRQGVLLLLVCIKICVWIVYTRVVLVNIRVQLLACNTVVFLLSVLEEDCLEKQTKLSLTHITPPCVSFYALLSSKTHPTHITALSQHLVSFEQIVPHQFTDFVLSLSARLDHLHFSLCRWLPLKVLVIWGQ